MGATNPPWKKFERELARDVGTERIPVTGERDGADFLTPMFLYQAKKRKIFPAYVAEWLDAARAKAVGTERTAVVVLQRPQHNRMDALVVLSWHDWLELHGNRVAGVG